MNEKLILTASIGFSLQELESSDAGKYLWGKAEAMERAAELEFRSIDPEDTKEVRRLQNEIKVADMFRKFMTEGIESGKLAEDEFNAQTRQD